MRCDEFEKLLLKPAIAARNPEHVAAGSIRTDSEPERPTRTALDEAARAQAENTKRYRVRVTSFRRRLLDEDNLCAKFHVDALRYFGLIPDDSPKICKIETSQVEVQSDVEEKTVIEIDRE